MKPHRFQVIVVGSGFAGSLMAMIAHRLGLATALIERGRHPRFVIGESSTPLASLLLEEIAEEYDLPFLRPLCKWGTWQRQTPELACGLKRGFTFYHHQLDQPFEPDPRKERQLLVAASPSDEIGDTHWYRPDFDCFLAEKACQLGVAYFDEVELVSAQEDSNGMRLTGRRHGESLEFEADFLIDASGPRGFLHRAFELSELPFAAMPPTQALFSHFTEVGPLPGSFHSEHEAPPYPVEQAAVHHIFPGGWVWVLKFNNGVTSAGGAATDSLANTLNFRSGEPGWQRLLERLPSLAEMFVPAKAVFPFIHQPRIAFRSCSIHGQRWALLPSAAGVVDPLLSTGFPLTLLGVVRLGRLMVSGRPSTNLSERLKKYAQITVLELETTARLVGALYSTMNQFKLFKELALLYFAAASFSEAARRLGKMHLADSFLLCRHPDFSKQLNRFCDSAVRATSVEDSILLGQEIQAAIEPFDIAGLTDKARDPWYPALPCDIIHSALKLSASKSEAIVMLRRCGLSDP